VSRTDPLDALELSLRRGAAELHVVRHADAVPESDGAFAVYDDYEAHPLSERGRAQARAVAERCAELDLAAVYASPIRRARETAEAIAAAAGVGVEDEPGVREIAIGPLEVAEPMTMRARLEWLAVVAMRDGSWAGIPGTEPSHEVRGRMLRALDAIAARHPGRRVAVVSHAGAINAAIGAIAGTPHDFVFPLANASISVVRVSAQRRLLVSANETAHLRDIPSRSRR
jgi:2,3-bisphosphoglycerate-dependent phosphoglycerate mutase